MGYRGLARLIYKKLGVGGVFVLIGIIALILLIRDIGMGRTMDSIDLKADIIGTIVGLAGGSALIALRKKKQKSSQQNTDSVENITPNRQEPQKPAVHEKSDAIFIDLKKDIVDPINAMYKPLPMLHFDTIRAETTVFDSKLGGTPYMPKDFTYPTDSGKHAGQPLKLLAQLNLDELVHIKNFPHGGMLQFFIAVNELYGVNFDDYNDRSGFKVIYHKDIIKDKSQLMSAEDIPSFDTDIGTFPFSGEFLLKPRRTEMCKITAADFRFENELIKTYNNITGESIKYTYLMNESYFGSEHTLEDMYDVLINEGTCMGGYPNFTQNDPRSYSKDQQSKTILLMQIDSDLDNDIMWGDMGIANFFITPEDLAAENFDNVLYTWDCG